MSNDPSGLAGWGDSNVRRYVGDQPVSFTDPTGLQAGGKIPHIAGRSEHNYLFAANSRR